MKITCGRCGMVKEVTHFNFKEKCPMCMIKLIEVTTEPSQELVEAIKGHSSFSSSDLDYGEEAE